LGVRQRNRASYFLNKIMTSKGLVDLSSIPAAEHPLAKIKFQSEVDATLGYLGSMSLKESIESTLKHIRFLFGEDIPDALVRTAVSLTYAEHVALKTK